MHFDFKLDPRITLLVEPWRTSLAEALMLTMSEDRKVSQMRLGSGSALSRLNNNRGMHNGKQDPWRRVTAKRRVQGSKEKGPSPLANHTLSRRADGP